ncbi:MAG: S8 family serine peptidase [Phycisphaerales bacterium]|nr:S8 family serine peptidase [Phycisphaerales bacterium]
MSTQTPHAGRRRYVLTAAAAIALLVSAAGADIPLTNGRSIETAVKSPTELRDAVAVLATTPDRTHIVVQFDGPVSPADRAALHDAGLSLSSYIGSHAFIAVLADGVDARAVSKVASLTDARSFEATAKMHQAFLDRDVPIFAVTDNADADNPTVAAYIMFHPDVDLHGAAANLVGQHDGKIISTLESINGMVINLPLDEIDSLAGADVVLWIEPPLPKLSTMNDSNRVITQVNDIQAAPYDLDGSGVNVLVYDGGTARASHNDFGGRCYIRDSSGLHYHSTHVAGTIGGSGVASGGTYKGMAPGVTIQSYGFEQEGGLQEGFLYSDPGDLEEDYGEAMNTFGAVIANNSIGTNTASNGFPCDWEGNYGVTSNLIDSIVRGSLGDPYLIVWANGNERGSGRCGTTYLTTAPPACAKNHITVGALNSNNDSMTSFSSWGPTDDGRIKPDISAPGCQSNDDGGVTSCYSTSDTSYGTLCGTSMASPTVCGIGALLLQDYRAQFGGPDFRNSTLKVLLAHTAHDLGTTGPDYLYGYGSVRAKDAVDFLRTGNFTEQELSQGGAFTFNIDVAPGTPELRITIAWDDVPAAPLAPVTLVNDIDLKVYDPSDTRKYPWTLNPANGSEPAVQTVEDHANNIEQVYVANPASGTWRIEVVATDIPSGTQIVSIGATPDLTVEGLFISMTSSIPDNVDPATPVDVAVEVTAIGETIVPGSVTMHHRLDGGTYLTTGMDFAGGDLYEGTLPGAMCDEVPEFYFSAEGTVSGVVNNPFNAPASVYTYDIGHLEILISHDMEADDGWTVGDVDDDATTGVWGRMDPQGTTAQPEDDHTPAPGTDCWVTDGRAGTGVGDYDVDGGKTTLFSPIFDLVGQADATIGYWRWYNNVAGATPNTDIFVVDISNDGGSAWTNVETVGPAGVGTSGGWYHHEFRLGDIIPLPSSQVMMRFIASDEGDGSIVEAAIDDLQIVAFVCEDPQTCPGDLNGDGMRDQADLGILLAAYGHDDGGDIDGDGDTDQEDLGLLLSVYDVPCP